MMSGPHVPLTRREMLKLSAAGVLGVSLSGWLEVLASRVGSIPGRKVRSCILLWMDGGPSQHETFDPKPDAPAEIRGDHKAIATSVPGIHISSYLPRIARHMHHAAVLRGMSTGDNNHLTARVLMHTGFRAGGGVEYPPLGSLVSSELGESQSLMPSFVVTGIPTYDSVKFPLIVNPGYLGPVHAPLVVSDLREGVENLEFPRGAGELADRLTVLEALEQGFQQRGQLTTAEAHRTTMRRAVQLMRSQAAQAFDLGREPVSSREPYGESYFGQGCLLARRLVEAGVPFIEVYLPDWDTHFDRRVDKNRRLSLPQLDVGLSALVQDLEERGLLESTLVIWMGEFGRTPRINKRAGRDHFSRAWSTVLLGGGIRGGQVIGKTDRDGGTVVERPISVADFMATICMALGIDYNKQNIFDSRPLRIVEKDASPVRELFG